MPDVTLPADRWQRLQQLFDRLRSESTAERERLLVELCADDPALLQEVRSLLEADAAAGPLDTLRSRIRSLPGLLDDSAPERIGAYRVLRELGRGGMGVVYLAERADGQYEHRVAIKLISTSDPDDPLHQRFLAERQILAALRHPNIARLLDGGITATGRPYLVLEYIDGLPITTYCERNALGIEERLRLFASVCEAVQHAHQNLVIHRDLKPSNIMVTADGRVHLLDFGIAKLLTPERTGVSAPTTRRELRLMTPEYASPEQVRGNALTTSSDVYSLGALLYELLTGTPPYQVSGDSPGVVLETVCERDPERPSARVAHEKQRRRLRGDLDDIVLMAMRKEPERRYASADLLRQDVERHLNGFPVLAHRDTRRYRVEKLLRRHRVEAVAALLVLLSLVGGLATSVREGRRAATERDRADRALVQAEAALGQSEAVTNFLMELFRTGDSDAPVAEVTAMDLLRRGIGRAEELRDQPVVRARLLDVMGQMSLHLGRYPEAHELLSQAVELRRAQGAAGEFDLSASLIHLAQVQRGRAQFETARALASEALEIRRRILPHEHPELALAYYEKGWVSSGVEQERHYREALRILQLTDTLAERQISLLQGLATNQRRQGKPEEALEAERAALALSLRKFGPDHAQTGQAMIHMADHLVDRPDSAEYMYRRGLELITRRYGEHSMRLVHGLNSLAELQAQRGRNEAEPLIRRALAIQTAARGAEHPQLAFESGRLATELARQGRFREAESTVLAAMERVERLLGRDHPAIPNMLLPLLGSVRTQAGRHREAALAYTQALALIEARGYTAPETHRAYGRLLIRTGQYEEAEVQLLRSLALLEGARGASHPNTVESKRALMELYRAWGKPERVEQYRVPPGRYVAY